MSDDIELVRAQAQIQAANQDRLTRRLLSFALVGGLFAVAATLAALVWNQEGEVPEWLQIQFATVITAIAAGAATAWGFNLGSSASSRAKDEK